MSVVVVGLNHRTTPLPVLEPMTVPPARLPKALHDLAGRDHLSEVAVVSTCLRTEVYAVVERFHDGVADIEAFFESRAGIGWSTGVEVPDSTVATGPNAST